MNAHDAAVYWPAPMPAALHMASLSVFAAALFMVTACASQLAGRRGAVEPAPSPSQSQPASREPSGGAVQVPVGSAYGRCYPNSTCDGDLVCDAQIDTCSPPPKLGSDGGPCYGNKTCDGYLICRQDRCAVPPAGDVELPEDELSEDELMQPDGAE